MYINYDYLYQHEMTDSDLHLLLKVKQKECIYIQATEDYEEKLDWLEANGYIRFGKKSKDKAQSAIIEKKGNQFLKNLQKVGYKDEFGELTDELISAYEGYDKHTGNKMEIQDRLTWFIGNTGFNLNIIKAEVDEYLSNNTEYTMSLENLIWKKPSLAYSVNKNLKDSRLYNNIVAKYNLDSHVLTSKKSNILWLNTLSKIKVPKGLPKEQYLTGNYKKDQEVIGKIKEGFLSLLKLK